MRMITGISRICANVPTAPDRKSTKRGKKVELKSCPDTVSVATRLRRQKAQPLNEAENAGIKKHLAV